MLIAAEFAALLVSTFCLIAIRAFCMFQIFSPAFQYLFSIYNCARDLKISNRQSFGTCRGLPVLNFRSFCVSPLSNLPHLAFIKMRMIPDFVMAVILSV